MAEKNPPASVPLETPDVGAAPVLAADLTAPLAEAMPPVSETAAPAVEVPVLKDKSGTVFDPLIHRINDDNTPRLSKNGWYIRKDHGRRPDPHSVPRPVKPAPSFAGGPVNKPKNENPAPDFDPANQIPRALPVVDQYDLLADVYLRNGYGPMILAFGGDILPDEEEHAALKNSLAAWLRIRRAREFSPGLAFGMTALAVFMKKMEKPTVREKAEILWVRVKQIYSRYFGKKE